MELNNLKYKHGSRGHKRKISGRGFGSYSIRGFKGNKGQGQRNTGNVRVGFEGGQTPLYRRTRKIGFNNYEFKTNYNVFSLQQLSQLKLTEINRETLKKALDNARWPIKIIGSTLPLKVALNVQVDYVTPGAKKAIEAAGGQVTLVHAKA